MTIIAHCLVKNEARFLWYSINSVINHVDKILLWDTGSTDSTIKIIKELKSRYPDKISTKFLKSISPKKYAKVREDMLRVTNTDWFIVVDGDEIWWEDSIKKVISEINKNSDKFESIVVPTINLIGDIYHFQEKKAGLYRLAGRIGHLSLRAVNTNIPGLSSQKPHGTWGWTDESGLMIQDRDPKKIKFIQAPYIHVSFLQRAGNNRGDNKVPKRLKKRKHEIGINFPKDFYYPESFFRPRPKFVKSPWAVMSPNFKFQAQVQTPLRKIKRRIFPSKTGY